MTSAHVQSDCNQGETPRSLARLFFWNTALAPHAFLSGLIDDVRIYSAALSADKIAALAQ